MKPILPYNHRSASLLIFVALSFSLFLWIGLGMRAKAAPNDAWQSYRNLTAGYAVDLPTNAQITESDDAALAYPLLFVRLLPDRSSDYQAVSILVVESSDFLEEYVAHAYARSGLDPRRSNRPIALKLINGRPSLRLERDWAVGDGDRFTTLIEGNGVIYRINLFGGGKGGETEPSAEVIALYDQIVRSFHVLDVALTPKVVPQAITAPRAIAIADVFTYPLRSGQGVNYGVPIGLITAGTRMEWLGYGIRNLDQWGVKCYGVDWSRMIHTGEDWYRLDETATTGASVYAVADGVVAKHNPGINYPGNVVIIRHRLTSGRDLYSMYGHITNVRVVEGQTVTLGQPIGTVLYQGYSGRTPAQHPTYDSHLHFEMRWFLDGTNIYVPGTNAYNYNFPACTYAYPGRGYTFIIHPDQYPYIGAGYIEPSAFIRTHLGTTPPPTLTPTQPPTATPTPTLPPTPPSTETPIPQSCENIRNGGFEEGLATTTWLASNSLNRNDPLIYQNLPRTGRWGAWFGSVVHYTDTLRQTLSLPANRSGATLRFWLYIQSTEAVGSAADQFQMLLILPNGSERIIGTFTTALLRNQWGQVSLPLDLSGVAGSTVTLALRGINNTTYASSFYVDDLSLIMPCASGVRAADHPIATTSPADAERSAASPNVVCSNFVRDGNFESGRLGVAWAAIANTASGYYTDAGIYNRRPRTGSYSAWLGSSSLNNVWNELLQTIQLPQNVTSVQLRYWRYLETSETDTIRLYDRFTVGWESEKGIQLVLPQQIDNTSLGRNTWLQQTLDLPNAPSYSGQKLWASFKATTDGSLPSSLYVDDVEVVVCEMR